MFYSQTNVPIEFAFTAQNHYKDIFNDIEVDVVFTGPDGQEWKVPAYWAGENTFRVRFAAPKQGRYTYKSICTNPDDAGLHGQVGELKVLPYDGQNKLYKHGGLRAAATKRTLEHADGTPFFWLGDTWWMGLCKRIDWPGGFRTLTADRVEKGFSVIHIVAGLYPDMPWYDERGANEAGFPWDKDFTRINPAYFDMADLKIEWLVRSGLAPCIVASWGYLLLWTGVESMKKHWRNLVARYGAYPVFWCLAGEVGMPYYLTKDREGDIAFQKKNWTEIARYVRSIDPYHRPLTAHPAHEKRGSKELEEPDLVDFNWLQTGHSDRESIPNTVKLVVEAYESKPTMPVINSEVCYEGIGEQCRQEVQRFMFWSCVLSGACGHSYGANGIWQVNQRDKPYGPSPHGMAWGNTSWEDASQLPGSGQLGLAKRLLERYEWWRFEPHPEWVEPHWTEEKYSAPFAGGIPGEVRVIYLSWYHPNAVVKDIEKVADYRAYLWNPVDGSEQDLGAVTPDADGNWPLPMPSLPLLQDWVLVLERKK